MKHLLFISIFLFCTSAFIFGQVGTGDTSAEGSFMLNGYNNFTTYSIEKGLPQSNIYSIIQDGHGYLWVGTDGGGVCKFDGSSFKIYDKKNGLSGNVVRSLLEDSKGRIWIGTDEGITVYNGLNFTNIGPEDSLSGNTVLALYEDTDNNIWAATDDGGVNKIRIENNSTIIESFTENEGLGSNSVFDIQQDNDGLIWLATMGGGISIISFHDDKNDSIKFDITVLEEGAEIPSALILSIEKDSNGDLYFGTYGSGAFKLDISEGFGSYSISTVAQLDTGTVWDICCRKNGEMWLGTLGNGIIRMKGSGDNDGPEYTHYSLPQGLPNNQILKVFEDNEMNMWLGTNGHGLCKYMGDYFTHYSKKEGLSNNMIWAIDQDEEGNFWIGSDGGGLSKLHFENGNPVFENFTTVDGLSSNFISDVAVGNANNPNIWIATTNKGICKFDPNNSEGNHFIALTLADGLIANSVSSILVDDHGIVWCGTAEGISRYDGVKFENLSMETMIMSDMGVKTIIRDKRGNFWFGSAGGLARYGGDGQLRTFDHEEGLMDLDINALAEGLNGNIWIGTNGGGIYEFDVKIADTSFPIHFVVDDSLLSSNSINSLVFVNDKVLIVATDRGFDKVQFDDQKKIIKTRSYNRSDGFIGVECNDNAIFKDKLGNIWFGTVKGISRYNPSKEHEMNEPPKVHLTSLQLFYKQVNWVSRVDSIIPWFNLPYSLDLPYTDNTLTFNFAGISLTNPEKVRYKFYLEGNDKEWAPLTNERKKDFSGLSHGTYTFHVKAINANGVESTEATTYSFEIHPPWYQTTTFYIICIGFIIIAVYVYIKWREQKLQKEKKVLEEKVEERTAEVVKQKDEIMEQKEEIEEKNKDIMDSINYAQTIQEAILPLEEERKALLKDSFVLFKPKDVVSGDFYWMAEKDGHTLFTAADCTGHGVPGAFMSMIGSALLTEVVIDQGKIQPNEVLNGVRDGIIKALKQTGAAGERKDGMDAALCMLNNKDNVLSFSGAQNPLYLI